MEHNMFFSMFWKYFLSSRMTEFTTFSTSGAHDTTEKGFHFLFMGAGTCFLTPFGGKANKKLLESKTYFDKSLCSTPTLLWRSDLHFFYLGGLRLVS